jgi:predicted alpha/beta hydrolase family esterase
MKDAIIFHGTGCKPESFWQPWLKYSLEKLGYEVWVPQLPNALTPDLKHWLPTALQGKYTPETVLIGHSAGGPLILSVLENLNVQIKQAILVAGYARPKGEKKEPEKILQDQYNWNKIKANCKELIFINSDNDPWGCNDIEGKYMQDRLGGQLIIRQGDGHMGSNKFNQPYREFPLLLELIKH